MYGFELNSLKGFYRGRIIGYEGGILGVRTIGSFLCCQNYAPLFEVLGAILYMAPKVRPRAPQNGTKCSYHMGFHLWCGGPSRKAF